MELRKEWNTEEVEYLKENVGFHNLAKMADKLGRSFESVRIKMHRIGLSNTKSQTGLITAGELAKILQVDRNTVKWWMKKYGLPCKKKVTRKSKQFYFIDPRTFWEWASGHKEKVVFSRIPPHALPPEPDWVTQERRKETFHQLCKQRPYKPWTTKEDQKLIELRQKGLTYAEIGEQMNRTANSVIRRYSRLKKEVRQ
ncbi:Myb-like DNA-binding domain-containing protein [Bacillus xiapuensis]|uniref:Myb-like DNA-binding domain-containing protein n=1 Tax=Bacillus xiapuensis TaxID=2014075 RepID=UPI000C2317A6|nr:Myb-like DNA-binding domain-containing protein [Bacillus xiapuensis]